jgi:hypothetical protein
VVRLVSGVVDRRVHRKIVRGNPVAGKEGIGQGKRLSGLRINDQEFFLNAERTHIHILRQQAAVGTTARRYDEA